MQNARVCACVCVCSRVDGALGTDEQNASPRGGGANRLHFKETMPKPEPRAQALLKRARNILFMKMVYFVCLVKCSAIYFKHSLKF